MENSRPIQVYPPGLLGFLQLKNIGRNPEELPNVLQPTLDLFDWIMKARAEDIVPSRVASAPGIALANGQIGLQRFSPNVPVTRSNEWWWVENYTVGTGTLGATDTSGFALGFLTPTVGASNLYVVGTPSPIVTGTANGRALTAFAGGFFLPPSSELVLRVMANDTATTISYSAFVRFTPLPI